MPDASNGLGESCSLRRRGAAQVLSLRQGPEASHTPHAACGAQLQGTANGVYVSSTFTDLVGQRAALNTALKKARYDLECMESTPPLISGR
jgi:hypothetical protein